ncbi:MAG: sugar phosphate isomerase/epimerase [Desulfobacteraceae bacterium]|nr:MAG: sugar phosphate isomerase/epimerase [Desulfobacteraceae bacterium]
MKSAFVLAVEPDIRPLGLGGDFETNARFISDLGFNGSELSIMDAKSIDTKRIKEITKRYDLDIPAIGAGRYFLKHGLFFSSKDKEVRRKAVQAVGEFTLFAGKLNSHFIIGPVQGNFENTYEEGFQQMRDCLRECAKVAEAEGVLLLLEPINRFTPAIIRTIEAGIRMIDEVDSSSVKMLVDTFHMNIEERSMTESIRKAKGYVGHVHFSDSNRLAPGQGHIDFRSIANVLQEIDYHGFVSGEILPEPDGESAARWTIELIDSLPYQVRGRFRI